MIRGAVPAARLVIVPKFGLLNADSGFAALTVLSTLNASRRS